ncbi:MAG: dTDP-4-dehydrorhamnose 3,5-epimerase [Henriciella sp.]|nr:dTDP-4-dehydrorhamnose 3,5-epimerase [Henriciella sp.]
MFEHLEIAGLILVKPNRHVDARGWFSESYRADAFAAAGIMDTFVQDNHSRSIGKGTIRGLHFQIPPHAQSKLVRCTQGTILDVAVDIRTGSPTFGQHASCVLSAENGHQLYMPPGFAHGFCTLSEEAEVQYKVSDYYARDAERGLAWNDPQLAIDWSLHGASPILSDKDRNLPRLEDLPAYFTQSQ